MVSRDWSRIWVGGTILLISFIAFTSQIFIVWPWYGKDISLDLLKLLVPFNCAVFMVFWNYRLCVVTSPGLVPKGWRPNMSSMEGMEIKRGTHAPRYCKTCQHYKPPRAHHCRQCNTCYLKVSLSRACNCASGSVLTVLLFGYLNSLITIVHGLATV
ncbi:palmitoyltransferase PFA4 [Cryptococcus depauperatus]